MAWVGWPPFGSRRWQSLWAAWKRELLTPSCCRVSLGSSPLLLASGKFSTPLERMQREKASSSPFCVVALSCVVVGAAGVEEATLATPGEPLPLPAQPAASSENAATKTTALTINTRVAGPTFGGVQDL
jgi:hypothetical protein